jgi:hypothetical protein
VELDLALYGPSFAYLYFSNHIENLKRESSKVDDATVFLADAHHFKLPAVHSSS